MKVWIFRSQVSRLILFAAILAQPSIFVQAAEPSIHGLQGQVKGSALITDSGLRKIGETTNDLRRACLSVIGEVNRKSTVVVKGPNVLPNGIVIQPTPSPSGTAEIGPALPPRTTLLNAMLRQVRFDVQLLRNEIDALIIPDEKASLIEKQWNDIRQSMATIESNYVDLMNLSMARPYNNERIAQTAYLINVQATRINRLRKEVTKLITRE